MGWITERLRNSRLAAVSAQVEKGEQVDWAKVRCLQSLDLATGGQLALADAIEREDEADEQFRRILAGGS